MLSVIPTWWKMLPGREGTGQAAPQSAQQDISEIVEGKMGRAKNKGNVSCEDWETGWLFSEVKGERGWKAGVTPHRRGRW